MLASCLLTSGFSGTPSSNATDVDVVIVGAGYAGLVTARQLTAQGVTVQVLEALPEAGGRARDYAWTSGLHKGHTLELGVAIIGNDEQMPFANELLRALNVSTFDFPVWGPGNCTGGLSGGHCNTSLLCRNGEGAINKFSTLFPGIVTRRCVGSAKTVEALLKVTGELMLLANGIDVDAPWEHPKAAEWDALTFGGWLRQQCDDDAALNYVKLTVEPDLSTSVDQVSLLHALFMAKTGGGVFDGLYAFNNVRRIKGGGALAARRMAELLGAARVRYGALVEAVEQDAGSVSVRTADGQTVRGKFAVLTGAPSVVGRIGFAPPLSPAKRQLVRSVPMGNAVRVSALYPWAWWRSRGLSGAWGDEMDGSFVPLGMDMTPCDAATPGACAGAPGVIQAQMQGAQAEQLLALPPQQRQANFTNFLAQFFGPDAVSRAEGLLAFDFSTEPTLGGGTQAHFPPGVWTTAGHALRAPHGRVHFAGAEYSALRFGYLDGAVRSANATAALLLELLAAERAL